MRELPNGTTLQSGKYRIIQVLGQGGFGITYLAEQTMLERKVAIKEFFMKELCERDDSTSQVSMGTAGSKETVQRFRDKFLKEARNIAKFNHPNIVHIIDVFEENGTAYYVMDYAIGGSLATKIKAMGCMSEPMATRYILQVADALAYIHKSRMNHLDIKPANIMLDENDDAIIIDFGLSKQYNSVTGDQTSTTPIGISEGYAPMEQYMQSGIGEFSPETDIYALGATYFKLLTGITPPSALETYENGIPLDKLKEKHISAAAIDAISKAMEPRKRDRTKSIQDFIRELKTIPMPPTTHLQYQDMDEITILAVDRLETDESHFKKEAELKAEAERLAKIEEQKAKAEAARKTNENDVAAIRSAIEKSEADRRARIEAEKQKNSEAAPPTRRKNPIGKILAWTLIPVLLIVAGHYYWKYVMEQEHINYTPTKTNVETETRIPTGKKKNTNGHKYVDLGLPSGLLWATCNVGASNPRMSGYHLSWGETSTKDQYTADTHFYSSTDSQLARSHDAAASIWGGGWRTPTLQEWQELSAHCQWIWDGSGYTVTGANGKSIYLPAAGYYKDFSCHKEGIQGDYWTSTPYGAEQAYEFYFVGNTYRTQADKRFYGASVRAVLK